MIRTSRLRATLLASALVLTGLIAPTPSSADVSAQAWQLTWSDEFNGASGSAPDSGKWAYDLGGGGFGNNEHQYYTNSRDNSAMDGAGNLVITARNNDAARYQCWYGTCRYTSARLLTKGKFTQAYGKFEARIQLPRGQGIWPAFWMMGDDLDSAGWPGAGEIDVMEYLGHDQDTVYGTIHGPGYSGAGGPSASYSLPAGQSFADGFHTFAIEWSPNTITWLVDGNAYRTRTPADIGGNRWVFDHPFFMLLNLAVGGNWPGYPDASTQFPQQLKVDYVKVFQGSSGPPPGGRITGLGGKCVDVNASGTANGTAVQLYDCNGTGAQNWSRPGDGTIRALGKCLDVNAGGTNDGALVQLWDCNGTGAQQWVVTGARDIVNPQADKCLDATGNSSANHTRLRIWTCSGGANQKWTVS